nr:hypothetical protein [Actinomyces sp.]
MSIDDTVSYVLTGSRGGTATRHVMAVSQVATRTLGGPDRARVVVRRLCRGTALTRPASEVERADRNVRLAHETGRLCATCRTRWMQALDHTDDLGTPGLLDLTEVGA